MSRQSNDIQSSEINATQIVISASTCSYNEGIAQSLGVVEAILFQDILYWVSRNKDDGNDFYLHEDRYWTRRPLKELEKRYSYFAKNTLHRALAKLVQHGLLLQNNFNKEVRDRTAWYTVGNIKLEYQLEKTDSILGNANPATGKCKSPMGEMYNKELNTQDINTNKKESIKKDPNVAPSSPLTFFSFRSPRIQCIPRYDGKGEIVMEQSEWNMLVAEFGEVTCYRVAETLSEKIASGEVKKPKDYRATLLNWLKSDALKFPKAQKVQTHLQSGPVKKASFRPEKKVEVDNEELT